MSREPDVRPMRILFIGNSYTSRNNLPKLIERLARDAMGVSVETRAVVAGGASLRRHWNAGEALALLRGSEWTHVVLQEQSTLPIKNPVRFKENVRLFDHEIRQRGARTVLYLTWARKAAPDSQENLSKAVTEIATELRALVVPVGPAWQRAQQADPGVVLYEKDGSHPTPAGSRLAAEVFCATLFHEGSTPRPARDA